MMQYMQGSFIRYYILYIFHENTDISHNERFAGLSSSSKKISSCNAWIVFIGLLGSIVLDSRV